MKLAMFSASWERSPTTRADATGRNISATTKLTSKEMHSGMPMAPNMTRSMGSPPMKISGRNTTTVVRVAREMARPTSRAPLTAASSGPLPSLRWRAMLSMTTTELSTSMPMPKVKPVMVKTLNEPPVKCSQVMARRADAGIDRATQRVMRTRRRNISRMRTDSPPPQMAVWLSWLRETSMNFA